MTSPVCGFIGLGLIGGSIAKALKSYDSKIKIIVFDPNSISTSAALKENIADKVCPKIDSSFSECDIIFLCAPVSCNNDNLLKIKDVINESAILTDIGSVKSSVHEKVHELSLDTQFIGGHPMAGTERIGFINSKKEILENAYYILTKTKLTSEQSLSKMYELVKGMGAIPLIIPFSEHDYVTAAISHVPHVVSAALVNLVRKSDSKDEIMKTIAAGGFKDITRISSSSPTMWEQICLTNSSNISKLLSDYIKELTQIKKAIDAADSPEIREFFSSARSYRESFTDVSSGPIKREFVLHIDISDQPGCLAKVVALLAENNVNIKNIGIVHNREYERGTLKIELHTQKDLEASKVLLKSNDYPLSV